MSDSRYFVIYKPYGLLSQFTADRPGQQTLADLHTFPKKVYPVGRLDRDSEGLLVLTDDNRLKTRLLDPRNRHTRTYWVQVEGEPTQKALQRLREGVVIRINKREHTTRPAQARLLNPTEVAGLPERHPPIRFRKNIPDSWMEITLTEGKNRQVRRMCAQVGFPVLRLVRTRIEKLDLKKMKGVQVVEMDREVLYNLLFSGRST
jgi:23S rRNA pseudouridine2457 synthase